MSEKKKNKNMRVVLTEEQKNANAEKLNEELESLTIGLTEEEKGERHYARLFKTLYVKTRKLLVLCAKSRNKTGSQYAYTKAVEEIRKVLPQ